MLVDSWDWTFDEGFRYIEEPPCFVLWEGVDCSGEVDRGEKNHSSIYDVVRDVTGELKKGGSGEVVEVV